MQIFLRTILSIIMIVFFHGMAYAAVWYPANQSTVAWDHTLETPLPGGDTLVIPQEQLSFNVWRIAADAADKSDPELLGNTADKSFVVSFDDPGQYLLGVQSVRTVPDVVKPIVSTISWSDDPVSTNDNPFGVEFFVPPAIPTGVRAE
jgi:hypothetical protein